MTGQEIIAQYYLDLAAVNVDINSAAQASDINALNVALDEMRALNERLSQDLKSATWN
jgi:hypothetical protein